MRRVTLLSVIAALGLPAPAHAAGYVALTVSPTQVAPGWSLSATVTSGSFYRGDEITGLTLRRSFLGGRGEELHTLRAHTDQTSISFDGRRGRWATGGLLGSAAAVDLAIEAAGPATAVAEAWACRGAFVRIPVTLRGTLTVRTETLFFKTIRRTRLSGFVTIDAGPVNCDSPTPTGCEPSSTLHAGRFAGFVLASSRRLGLQFRQPVSDAPAGSAAWYHVLAVSGYDALAGSPPTVRIAAPIRGSLAFVGEVTTESATGACRKSSTIGVATGTLRTSFVGWGPRTLRLQPGVAATYIETL